MQIYKQSTAQMGGISNKSPYSNESSKIIGSKSTVKKLSILWSLEQAHTKKFRDIQSKSQKMNAKKFQITQKKAIKVKQRNENRWNKHKTNKVIDPSTNLSKLHLNDLSMKLKDGLSEWINKHDPSRCCP